MMTALAIGWGSTALWLAQSAPAVERKLGSGELGSDQVAIVLLFFAALVFPAIFLWVILKLRKLEAHAEEERAVHEPPADAGDLQSRDVSTE